MKKIKSNITIYYYGTELSKEIKRGTGTFN